MCNLAEYASFTNQKFRQVAFSSSYAFQEAVQAWNAITAELAKLGQISGNYRAATCSVDAGICGCKLIDFTDDKTACDWAHRIETLITFGK